MKVLTWDEFRSGRAGSPIASVIGVFDGLHIGHRELIARVRGRAGLMPTVITFSENPKKLLSPGRFDGGLSTLAQRLSLFDSTGVDLTVMIDFSGDFSKLPGRQFLSLLSESGYLRYLVVGSDFRCGSGLDTDAQGVREFCQARSIGVELLDAVQWAGLPVSSSRIRKAIVAGQIEEAAHMLGRPYEIDLRGSSGQASGPIFPIGGQASPPPGPYLCRLSYEGGDSPGERVAVLGADGSWTLPPESSRLGRAAGVRLLRKVSRE